MACCMIKLSIKESVFELGVWDFQKLVNYAEKHPTEVFYKKTCF